MVRYLMIGMMLVGTGVALPRLASAQTATQDASQTAPQSTSAEDPNDKTQQDRSFEETRKHMELHSEWSKKSGKMNDN